MENKMSETTEGRIEMTPELRQRIRKIMDQGPLAGGMDEPEKTAFLERFLEAIKNLFSRLFGFLSKRSQSTSVGAGSAQASIQAEAEESVTRMANQVFAPVGVLFGKTPEDALSFARTKLSVLASGLRQAEMRRDTLMRMLDAGVRHFKTTHPQSGMTTGNIRDMLADEGIKQNFNEHLREALGEAFTEKGADGILTELQDLDMRITETRMAVDLLSGVALDRQLMTQEDVDTIVRPEAVLAKSETDQAQDTEPAPINAAPAAVEGSTAAERAVTDIWRAPPSTLEGQEEGGIPLGDYPGADMPSAAWPRRSRSMAHQTKPSENTDVNEGAKLLAKACIVRLYAEYSDDWSVASREISESKEMEAKAYSLLSRGSEEEAEEAFRYFGMQLSQGDGQLQACLCFDTEKFRAAKNAQSGGKENAAATSCESPPENTGPDTSWPTRKRSSRPTNSPAA